MIDILNKLMLPPARGNFAQEYDKLFWFEHLASLVLVVGLIGVAIYFVIKYRRKSEDEVTPVIKNNRKLEVLWSVIPLVIVMICFAWGYKLFVPEESPPDDAYQVKVTAQQWLWHFTYEDGTTSTGDLHVPAGRPVKLLMNSKDVIHSFYVPAFRLKQDIVPGRRTLLWFKATKIDTSILFCAEYCGTGHSHMMGNVIVQKQQDFNNWLKTQSNGGGNSNLSPVEMGKQLRKKYACNTCHSVDGSKMTGPTWKGLYGSKVELKNGSTVTADDDYLTESILHSNAKITKGYNPVMPNFAGQLSDKQVNALIEYIKTLK